MTQYRRGGQQRRSNADPEGGRCFLDKLTPPGCFAVSSETIASASLSRDFFCVSRQSSSRRIDARGEESDDDGVMVGMFTASCRNIVGMEKTKHIEKRGKNNSRHIVFFLSHDVLVGATLGRY